MVNILVKKFRKSNPLEKQNIARELAKIGTNETIGELKRMVEGRNRRWFSRYNLDDQLIGVAALGEFCRKDVRGYLKNLYKDVVFEEGRSEFSHLDENFAIYNHWVVENHKFSNAPKLISDNLNYEVVLTNPEEVFMSEDERRLPIKTGMMREKKDIDYDRFTLSWKSKTHSVFRKAIYGMERYNKAVRKLECEYFCDRAGRVFLGIIEDCLTPFPK